MSIKFLLVLLAVAVFTDIRYYKIPNALIITGLVGGLCYRLYSEGAFGILSAVVGVTVPILILYPVFLIKGLGAGDVKLFSVIGIFLTVHGIFYCILVSLFIGGAISLIFLLIKRRSLIQSFSSNNFTKIHFSIPICLSVILHLGGLY